MNKPLGFGGFPPLDANYTMCPNVFFDRIVGFHEPCVVNVVAILIRETLGWLNQHGRGRKIEAELPLSTFVKHGLSQETARKGLRLAAAAGFIIKTEVPSPKDPARYALRWEDPKVQKDAIKEERRALQARRTKSGGLRDNFTKKTVLKSRVLKSSTLKSRVLKSRVLKSRVLKSKESLNRSSPEKKEESSKGLTSSLGKEPDILDSLPADQWAPLEAEARSRVIAETADPVRQLAKDGKAWTSVKPMMRKLLTEIR